MEIQKTNNLPLWAGVSALLAIACNYLFLDKYLGVSVFIYGVLLLGALFWFCRKNNYSFKPALWLSALFLVVTALPTFRANQTLIALDSFAAILLYLLMIRVVTKDKLIAFGLLDYVFTVILWPLKFVGGFIESVGVLIRGAKGIPQGKAKRILIGVLSALPVLIFFGLLFASADLAFRHFAGNIFNFNVSDAFIPKTIFTGIVFALCLGGFYYLLNPFDKTSDDISELLGVKNNNEVKEDRSLEVTVFLSLIAALFLLFIGFQINYFFGGVSNITFGGFTYAEYARKGFWELLVVAFSTLVILLFVDKYTKHLANRKNWFIWPSLFVIVEVLVIMFAAFKRMALYQDAYGLTELRLYVSAFIVLLAIIFIILVVKFVLNKNHAFFAFGVFCSVSAFLVAMNLVNPDLLIAKQNIERFNKTEKIDTQYLLDLSADAHPVILKSFKPAIEEDKEMFKFFLEERPVVLKAQMEDWQSFNFSRAKAIKAFEDYRN